MLLCLNSLRIRIPSIAAAHVVSPEQGTPHVTPQAAYHIQNSAANDVPCFFLHTIRRAIKVINNVDPKI
jgi:hypothetical protein